jgi:hypothetical protein
MSPEHHVLFKKQFIKAKDLLHIKSVKKVPYYGEVLYNILFKSYRTITVNNMICESLHPKSRVAALYQGEVLETIPSMFKPLNKLTYSLKS